MLLTRLLTLPLLYLLLVSFDGPSQTDALILPTVGLIGGLGVLGAIGLLVKKKYYNDNGSGKKLKFGGYYVYNGQKHQTGYDNHGGYESNHHGGYDNNHHGGYDNNHHGGHDSSHHGGYGSNNHGGYGSSHHGGYGNSNHGGYGSSHLGGYGSSNHGGYGTSHHGGYGGGNHGSYGGGGYGGGYGGGSSYGSSSYNSYNGGYGTGGYGGGFLNPYPVRPIQPVLNPGLITPDGLNTNFNNGIFPSPTSFGTGIGNGVTTNTGTSGFASPLRTAPSVGARSTSSQIASSLSNVVLPLESSTNRDLQAEVLDKSSALPRQIRSDAFPPLGSSPTRKKRSVTSNQNMAAMSDTGADDADCLSLLVCSIRTTPLPERTELQQQVLQILSPYLAVSPPHSGNTNTISIATSRRPFSETSPDSLDFLNVKSAAICSENFSRCSLNPSEMMIYIAYTAGLSDFQ